MSKNVNEYEFHRTIGLMKCIIKRLINKVRNTIKLKMGQEGFSYVQDSGTRITSEQAIQI